MSLCSLSIHSFEIKSFIFRKKGHVPMRSGPSPEKDEGTTVVKEPLKSEALQKGSFPFVHSIL